MRNSNYIRVYNEDCLQGARKYIATDSVDLIITDPPYGIRGDALHKHYHRREDPVISGYVEIPAEQYYEFSLQWIQQAERVLRPGGSIYIVSGYSNLADILNALRQTSLQEQNHLIWKYNFGVFTKNKYVSSHYHILYFTKPGGKVTFNTWARYGAAAKNKDGGSLNYADREDVWLINREYKPGQVKNKNELPLELLVKILQYSSNEADLVADFFLGGFSTARAAIGLKRRITGFEINPNSFAHHLKKITALQPGFLKDSVLSGKDDRPLRQGKPWSGAETTKLLKRYREIYAVQQNKRKTISVLEKEFQRGYFAILNRLEMAETKK